MKKISNKKNYVLTLVLIALFTFSFFAKTANAADKWFYWVDTPAQEQGIIGGAAGFNSKTECESSNPGYTTIGTGHKHSTGCYSGGNVTVTGYTLDQGTTGKAGDYLTINGTNFVNVKHILFGTIESEVDPQQGDTTKVRTKVPVGAVTAKITVKTEFRGSTTTPSNFIVAGAPANTDPWVFLNAQRNYIGESATQAECQTKLNAYVNDPANGIVDKTAYACSQHPQAEITQSQSTNDNSVPTDAQKDTVKDDSYHLLAPIGTIDTFNTKNIGDYFNMIFKLAIGLCAALAVIMIIISAVQYMGDESIFGKTEAKGKIINAILGLFIALGAYALLNTINPDLTGANGVSVDQVSATIDQQEAVEVQNDGGGTGTTKLCSNPTECKALCVKYSNGSTYNDNPPGVMPASQAQQISGIPLVTASCANCTASASVIQGLKSLKSNIDSLIAQKSIPNRQYSFVVQSAYRPAKDQIRVMCKNENIYQNPDKLGVTYAYPSLSRHGVGTAVDLAFYWGGAKVNNCSSSRTDDNNYTIEKIMDKAGFQRLKGEAWHFEYGGGANTCKYPNCGEPKVCSLK